MIRAAAVPFIVAFVTDVSDPVDTPKVHSCISGCEHIACAKELSFEEHCAAIDWDGGPWTGDFQDPTPMPPECVNLKWLDLFNNDALALTNMDALNLDNPAPLGDPTNINVAGSSYPEDFDWASEGLPASWSKFDTAKMEVNYETGYAFETPEKPDGPTPVIANADRVKETASTSSDTIMVASPARGTKRVHFEVAGSEPATETAGQSSTAANPASITEPTTTATQSTATNAASSGTAKRRKTTDYRKGTLVSNAFSLPLPQPGNAPLDLASTLRPTAGTMGPPQLSPAEPTVVPKTAPVPQDQQSGRGNKAKIFGGQRHQKLKQAKIGNDYVALYSQFAEEAEYAASASEAIYATHIMEPGQAITMEVPESDVGGAAIRERMGVLNAALERTEEDNKGVIHQNIPRAKLATYATKTTYADVVFRAAFRVGKDGQIVRNAQGLPAAV